MRMGRFVTLWLACVAGLMAMVIGVNLAVDPYGVFGSGDHPRPRALAQPYLAKTYMVERIQPGTVLMGSSRVEIGLDPASPAWPAEQRPVFNFGLGGASAFVDLRFLQHTFAVARPRRVAIGIGLEDCIITADTRSAARRRHLDQNFQERLSVTRSGKPNPRQWRARIRDAATALLSLTAFGDSLATLLDRDSRGRAHMTPLGYNDGGDLRGAVAAEGHYSLFSAKDKEKATRILDWSRHPDFHLAPLRETIALARRHGAEVVVFIAPEHADALEIYRQAGVWDDYERWKDKVVEVVGEFGGAVTLWDFSGYNRYTTETVPAEGDRATRLAWFWEADHFKRELGDLIIARLNGGGPPDLGRRLTADTRAAQAMDLSAERQRYLDTHPGDVERVARLTQAQACQGDPARCRPTLHEADHPRPPPTAPAVFRQERPE